MKKLGSLMGRRQFLVAAGVTSALGLGHKKLSGVLGAHRSLETAMASGADVASKTVAGVRYSHLLSPLKIGNVILKNRMMHTRSLPHFLQGPESFPSEQVISHYATVAKTAAIVTCRAPRIPPRVREDLGTRGDMPHMASGPVCEDMGGRSRYSPAEGDGRLRGASHGVELREGGARDP